MYAHKSREHCLANASIFDFWSSELWHKGFLWFGVSVLCYTDQTD